MESILVSACLLGEHVRYDGRDKRCDHPVLLRWLNEGRVVSICPETAGGLPVPRPAAEIANAASGLDVLSGLARVMDLTGQDVSAYFIKGAEQALDCVRARHIRIAILKEGSPSCGTGYTYDGSFTSRRVTNPGVCAARLQQAGVHVFSEGQLAEADHLLMQFEAEKSAQTL